MKRDPVTADVRWAVFARDGRRCIAPRLGASDECAGPLTLDHVKDQPMMGKRAPSDPAHLASICRHHHLDGWATAHRPELRAYLGNDPTPEGWSGTPESPSLCGDDSWDTRYACTKLKGHPVVGPGLTDHDYRPKSHAPATPGLREALTDAIRRVPDLGVGKIALLDSAIDHVFREYAALLRASRYGDSAEFPTLPEVRAALEAASGTPAPPPTDLICDDCGSYAIVREDGGSL